jgi:hypothetical protein
MAWRGSARAAMMASSQGKSPTTCRRITQLAKHRSHRGQGRAARDQARGCHGQDLELRRRRGCERLGSNRQDLADRRNSRCLIYRLGPILAADSGGAHRNWAQWRRGDAVSKESVRGKMMRVSEGVRPVRLTEPPGWVRPGRLASTGGPRLAEREVRGRGFNQKLN